MERRNFMKTAGGIGTATALGGVGLVALSGNAAAELDGTYTITDPSPVDVDDGSYNYVEFGAAAVFEWQGFDEPATHVTFEHEINTQYNEEATLYEGTFALDDFTGDATENAGGSLEWSTGSGHNGVLHTGVGDADPLIHSDMSWKFERDHDLADSDTLEGQGSDTRWPVIVHPDYDGDLYGVPDPLITDSLEADDGKTKKTDVRVTKNVTVHTDNESVSASIELTDTFTVEITNIESQVAGEGEGDTDVDTDEETTA